MTKHDQYARAAERWTESQYADPGGYLAHRAELVVELGARPSPGDEVLDLACGDGGFGVFLTARGLTYHGVDATPAMVAVATERYGDRATFDVGDLATYVPPSPVALTTCFRALYYAGDLPSFFAHVRGYTTRKLVFDLNPRRYDVGSVAAMLTAAGFARVELRPFFRPQRFRLGSLVQLLLTGLERSGPLARMILRRRFTYVVAASCD